MDTTIAEYREQFVPFSLDEYSERLQNVIELMDEEGLDIMVVSQPEHIYYLSNYQTAGCPLIQVLLVSKENIHLITRELEVTNCMYRSHASYTFYNEAQDPVLVVANYLNHNYKFETVGFEYESERMTPKYQSELEKLLREHNKSVAFKDCSTLVSSVMTTKSVTEVHYAKEAANFVEQGIKEALDKIEPGMMECEIAGIITHKMMSLGSEYTAYPCFISAGWTGNMGHYAAEQKRLEEGDLLFMEIGGSYKRYHAARMHTVYIGDEQPQWFTDAESLIRMAIATVKKIMVPGVMGYEVDYHMRNVLNGYSHPYVQSERSGYCIGPGFFIDWALKGFRIHPSSEIVLKEGMVIHLIPWIQLPIKGAIGFSDTVVVTKDGAVSLFENLSSSKYEKSVKYILKDPVDKNKQNKDALDILSFINKNMDDALTFHRTNPLCKPTNLVIRDNVPGINKLYIKDEGDRMGLKAFKIAGVSYAVHKLEQEGVLKPDSVITTMTDGNHGSAVACIAKQRGYKAIIFIPKNMTKERRQRIVGLGAECRVVEGMYDDAIEVVKKKAKKKGWILISDTAWTGYETIPKYIATGYSTIFNEVYELLDGEKLTHIFLQTGVGGFPSAGVAYAVSKMNPVPKLICVEPEDADCMFENIKMRSEDGTLMSKGATNSIMSGLNCGMPSKTAWPLMRDYVSAYVAIGDRWAKDAVRIMYHDEQRVFAGESGGAGLAGLLACLSKDELKHGIGLDENSNVLVVNTESATDMNSFNSIIGYQFYK